LLFQADGAAIDVMILVITEKREVIPGEKSSSGKCGTSSPRRLQGRSNKARGHGVGLQKKFRGWSSLFTWNWRPWLRPI